MSRRTLELAAEVMEKLASIYGVSELIEVAHVHISGVSYLTIGDAGLEFLEDLASKGTKFRVPATVNPIGFDLEYVEQLNIPQDFVNKQLRILNALKSMGANLILSCTPYEIIDLPPGTHVAWGESNAVIYANSILGLRTNREGGPLTVLAAILGKVPKYGLHLDEVRKPTHLVEVEYSQPLNHLVASALGYLIGELVVTGVPLIRGNIAKYFSESPHGHELVKLFLASLATSSQVNRCIIPNLSRDYSGEVPSKVVKIEGKDIKKAIDELSSGAIPDIIAIGCPHCSLKEVMLIYEILEREGIRAKKPFLLFTSRRVKEELRRLGILSKLTERGVLVCADTCIVVSPIVRTLGIKVVMTNSGKAAHYLRRMHGIDVVLGDLRDCIREVCSGV